MSSDQPKFRPLERFWPYADLPEQPTEQELASLDPDLYEALFGSRPRPFSITIVFPELDAPEFPKALELARGSAEFRETGSGAQRRYRARFAFEALAHPRIADAMGRQHFDGHRPIESGIAGTIHLAHPARPERVDDLIRSKPRSWLHHKDACSSFSRHLRGEAAPCVPDYTLSRESPAVARIVGVAAPCDASHRHLSDLSESL